ncbi:hypothetical protein [Acrocarpospora catenulata]|uniref:hypothetical protein n=1 Tax=Acrocarpospora catenulata TaxID=2836182 RepID=UPI001BD9E9AF|nr:hypothetical protein [Acrocarpospora catenulata]
MKIRVICLPDEVDDVTRVLADAFDLIEISAPYPMRGTSRNVRVYAEVRLQP